LLGSETQSLEDARSVGIDDDVGLRVEPQDGVATPVVLERDTGRSLAPAEDVLGESVGRRAVEADDIGAEIGEDDCQSGSAVT
jgi:hypothetical protein